MHRLSPLAASLLLLSACAAPAAEGVPVTPSAQETSSSASSARPLEAYPMELTVEHFAQMTLSGSALTIGGVQENNAAYARHTITYRSNGVLVSGTLAIPHGEGRHPLIVQNHGYIDPAVYTNGRGLRREQDALARAGFAVLHTDYRKHAQSDPDPDMRNIYDAGLAYAMDSANAVLAVRELNDPRIDASKVGMLGHSMGGGVTMHILVARPDLIDAAVLYAPVSADAWLNFARWRLDDRPESAPTLEAMGTRDERPDAWAALSQSGSLQVIDDSVLLFHGTLDKDVPIAWSDDLHLTLQRLDKDVRYIVYPREGHEFSTEWRHFIDTTIEFYRSEL